MDEWELIEWMRRSTKVSANVTTGIGDDAAVLRGDDRGLLVVVDMLIEGVHFDLSQCSPEDVGRKALNVNLSDIAAMAGRPTAAVAAVGLPHRPSAAVGQGIYRGLSEAAAQFDVAIVGGDTNSSPHGVVVSVTVLGTPTASGPVLRSGARPGDVLFATGQLGYSILGKHLHFTPRVAEAQQLHERYTLTSMIDLSDGLAGDLQHLTRESGCGAIVEADRLPIVKPKTLPADDDRTPLSHALDDGEDFELLFTVPIEQADPLEQQQVVGSTTVTRIGVMTEDPEILLRDKAGLRRLQGGGFTHRL